MKAKFIYFLTVMSCLSACSDITTEEQDIAAPVQTAYQKVTFLAESEMQQTISAFRRGDSGFAFLKTIPFTGTRTEAQLPVGSYQFLFAASYGTNMTLNTPEPGTTLFPSMRFSVLPDGNTGNIRVADELFLQNGKVDSVYTIDGPSTIHAELKRAVAQVVICVKRGTNDGNGNYSPLPYTNDSIVRYFSNIQLDIAHAATSVDAHGITEGEGSLSVTIPANTPDSITPEGFAVYTGPFFLPAANGADIDLKLHLYRQNSSPQPDLSLAMQARAERNIQLILTAWVTADWNFIGITADIRAISRETDGEQDIWEDNIMNLSYR